MSRFLTLTVCDRVPSYTDVISPDTYRYNAARGWRWLQRLCFWVLRKLDCRAVDKQVSYETITVDQTKIPQTALEQITRIKRRGDEPDFILMGPQEYDQIEQAERLNAPYSYTAYYAQRSPYTRNPQYYGLKVRVVPDFKGCVVVPCER